MRGFKYKPGNENHHFDKDGDYSEETTHANESDNAGSGFSFLPWSAKCGSSDDRAH